MKFIFLFICAVTLWSCQNDQKSPSTDIEIEETDASTAVVIEELRHTKKNLNEAISFYSLLYSKGYNFKEDILLSPNYETSTKQKEALAMGAYGADMSYASVFGQVQSANRYAVRIAELAKDMGLGTSFTQDLMEQLASNDSSLDKTHLISMAYLNASEQLHSEERGHNVALMIAGGWIEGLLISASLTLDKPGDREINLDIYDQIYNYHTAVKVLEAFESHEDCKQLLEGLRADEPFFKELLRTRGNLGHRDLEDLDAMMIKLRNGFLEISEAE